MPGRRPDREADRAVGPAGTDTGAPVEAEATIETIGIWPSSLRGRLRPRRWRRVSADTATLSQPAYAGDRKQAHGEALRGDLGADGTSVQRLGECAQARYGS